MQESNIFEAAGEQDVIAIGVKGPVKNFTRRSSLKLGIYGGEVFQQFRRWAQLRHRLILT
jgi:hypothetical protein